MAQIDKLIEMMNQRQAEKAMLISDKATRLFVKGQPISGAAVPASQLLGLLRESAPPEVQPQIGQTSSLRWTYTAPNGVYNVAVTKSADGLSAVVVPISKATTPPESKKESSPTDVTAPENETILEIMTFEALASSPQANWFFVHKGRRFGPVSYDIVKDLCIEKELTKNDLLWREGMKEWQPIGGTNFTRFCESLAWLTLERGVCIFLGAVICVGIGGFLLGHGQILIGLSLCFGGGRLIIYGREGGMRKSPSRVLRCLNRRCKILNMLTRAKCSHCGGDLDLMEGLSGKQK